MLAINDLNTMLSFVITDAISIGFPVPDSLDRRIHIDKNTYDRVGACYRYVFPERYEIHLSEATTMAKQNEIKNIIAHEVIHAHFLTMEHNYLWQMYQYRMNNHLGYNIQLKYSWSKIIK